MIKKINLTLLIAVVFAAVFAFAQEVVAPPTQEEIASFLASLGGIKGAGTMAIVATVVQFIMLLAKSGLGKMAGVYQILLVSFLTLVGGVVGLKMNGLDWGSAILHSSSLAAGQVFLHQLYKQFIKKDEAKKA